MIVEMAKVEVLGPRRRLPEALAFLQREGVLELRAAPGRSPAHPITGPRDDAEERRLAAIADGARRLLAALPAPPADAAAPPLPSIDAPEYAAAVDRVRDELRALDAKQAALVEESETAARYRRLVSALAPLKPSLGPGVEPQTIGLLLRRDRADTLGLLERELRALVGDGFDLQWREIDADLLGVLLTVPRAQAGAVASLLFERGIDEIKLPPRYANQSLVRALLALDARARELPADLRRLDEERAALAARVAPSLQAAARDAEARLDAARAVASCGETAHAFVVWGWTPRERVAALAGAAARALGPGVEVMAFPVEPSEYGEVPVVLRNPRFLRPFELLLALVPLPRYGTIDPTAALAIFFPLFFGLVLGDAGFGLIALAALALVRRRLRTPVQQQLAVVAAACAVSAVVFGVFFGELFGSLGAHLGMRPLLMDRRAMAIPFLMVSLAIGAGHVVIGIALGAWEAARRGHVREAVGRAAHALLLVGAALLGAGVVRWIPLAPSTWMLAVLGALALTAVVAGGPLGLLELVLSAGHVLSYARLMALGLASVMLADLANHLGATVKPAALGWALALLLHAVNFTLGLISPTVCALRLQYVEFFDKFYQAGGRAWRPFALPPLQQGGAHV